MPAMLPRLHGFVAVRGAVGRLPRDVAVAVAGAWLLVVPGTAGAQPDGAASRGLPNLPIAVGGEVSAVLGPADHSAYFNYTGYESNALRTSRVRLFGEWRLSPAASLIGELRLEGASDLTAPALYLRWQPAGAVPLFVQAGRIPPLVGAFARRAYGRDNAVIGLPLAYQYLTSLRADALPLSIDDVIAMRGRGWAPSFPIGTYDAGPGVPLVGIAGWDTGAEVSWRTGRVELAAALTRGSPSLPVVRDTNDGVMWSTRASTILAGGLAVGVSGGRGQWMDRSVLERADLPAATAPSQAVTGLDVEYGRGAWLVRGEVLRAAFTLPLVVTAPEGVSLAAWSAFGEVRYRPHPRWQIGTRVERLEFAEVVGTAPDDRPVPWDAPVSRVETVLTYRVTRAVDVRAGWQYNWRSGGRVRARGFPVVSALVWF